jgi:hypothetical protein
MLLLTYRCEPVEEEGEGHSYNVEKRHIRETVDLAEAFVFVWGDGKHGKLGHQVRENTGPSNQGLFSDEKHYKVRTNVLIHSSSGTQSVGHPTLSRMHLVGSGTAFPISLHQVAHVHAMHRSSLIHVQRSVGKSA